MLKKIVLHGPAVDSAGGYHDAGAELDVIEKGAKAGAIHADAAKELLDRGSAVSKTQADQEERAADAVDDETELGSKGKRGK